MGAKSSKRDVTAAAADVEVTEEDNEVIADVAAELLNTLIEAIEDEKVVDARDEIFASF